MSSHTLIRRSRYLLYSPNKVMNRARSGPRRARSSHSLPKLATEFVAGAAHVPVARDQPDARVPPPLDPALGFLGIGTCVDRFRAEVDAAVGELCLPPSRRTRSSLRTEGSAPAMSSRLPLPSASSSAGMLDAALAAGDGDDRLGLRRILGRRLAERHREQGEAEAQGSRKESRRAIIIARAMP